MIKDLDLSLHSIDVERCLSFSHDPFMMPDEFVFPALNFGADDDNDKRLDKAD